MSSSLNLPHAPNWAVLAGNVVVLLSLAVWTATQVVALQARVTACEVRLSHLEKVQADRVTQVDSALCGIASDVRDVRSKMDRMLGHIEGASPKGF